MIEHFKTPEAACLNCHKVVDRATSMTDGPGPCEGDVSVCLDCGHLAIYGKDLQFRHPTEDELVELAGDPAILRAMKVVELCKQQKVPSHARHE